MLFFLPALVAGYQLSADCGTDEYLNTSNFECTSCPSNQVPTADQLDCECAAGYAKTAETANLPTFECEACTSGTIPVSDQSDCIDCGSASYNSETFFCECAGATSVPLETFFEGGYRDTVACTACADNFYPGSTAIECEACPDKTMIRDDTEEYACVCQDDYTLAAEDTCIPDDEITSFTGELSPDNANAITYFSHETSADTGTHSLDSNTFLHYYLKAAWL